MHARDGPVAVMAGSSNLGFRSFDRDVEAGVFLVTRNEGLRRRVMGVRGCVVNHVCRSWMRCRGSVVRWVLMRLSRGTLAGA